MLLNYLQILSLGCFIDDTYNVPLLAKNLGRINLTISFFPLDILGLVLV